jgi:phospholipase/lecithinase/hemolysin
MLRRVFATSLVVLAVSLSFAADALSYTGIYAFGDSLSDVGNLCPTPCGGYPVPPNAPGRFSNGPVWVEGLAAGLGFTMTRSSAGGNDYAVGGATTTGVLTSQVPLYLTAVGGAADPTALYVLLAGGNDGLGGGNPITAANNMVAAINDLKSAGAQSFLVANLPDLSLTPAVYGNAGAQLFSTTFNSALASGLATITGVTIFGLDLYSQVNQTVANPGLYGFSNVNTPCWTGGLSVCATPDSYLFWDAIHPTTAAHGLLAEAALLAIPEPGTASLLLVGLIVLASRRRRASR